MCGKNICERDDCSDSGDVVGLATKRGLEVDRLDAMLLFFSCFIYLLCGGRFVFAKCTRKISGGY